MGCYNNAFRNRIGIEGVRFLNSCMYKNKSLSIIDISSNRILNKGFTSLIEAISGLTHIDSINVSNNEITYDCFDELGEKAGEIVENVQLRKLDISYNKIRDRGIGTLCRMFKKCRNTLLILNLTSC